MVHTVERALEKNQNELKVLRKEKAELVAESNRLEVLIAIKDSEIELFKNYYLGDMTKEEYDKKMDVLNVLRRAINFIKKVEDEKKGE